MMNIKLTLFILFLLVVFSHQVKAINLPVYKITYRKSGNSCRYLSKNHLSTQYTGQKGSFTQTNPENTLPVYKPRVFSAYQSRHITLESQNYRQTNFTAYSTSHSVHTAFIDYTNRKPFQEEEITPAIDQLGNGPMTEDDPPFPGDPGQMPLTDGALFLLGAVAMYALIKRKINDLT